uniref:Uncharacterized protein n=1 Tax=Apteryx owenii TaxID=8824 RepID=A0A8B9PNY0_APTOW
LKWYNLEDFKESWQLMLYLLQSAVPWQSHLTCTCQRQKVQSWFLRQYYAFISSPNSTLLGYLISLKHSSCLCWTRLLDRILFPGLNFWYW